MKKTSFWILVVSILLMAYHSWAGERDLRPLFEKYGIGIYDQGERNTCSVFAITGLLEFEYAHHSGQQVIPLSVEYLNWASNQITGKADDGSYFSDAVSALNQYGICMNELFPYYILNYSNKVEPLASAIKDAQKRTDASLLWIKDWDPNTGMTDEQIGQVKDQIMKEHPVAIGFRWPKKDEQYRKMMDGVMIVPPAEGVFDGHSVIMVGFKDDPAIAGGGYFIFKNSHGKDYGQGGYGKMPYEYLQKYANDGVAIHLKQSTNI
jgi:C1A family cysteine protease